MQTQDYFSLEHVDNHLSPSTASPIYVPRLTLRSYSASPSAPRRIPLLQPPSLDADASSIRRTVSFSSWTRFTTLPISTPTGQLKASVLCKASGLSPSYDPPASEWVYLGVEQPIFTGRPEDMRKFHWRRQQGPGQSSMSSSSSCASIRKGNEAITFARQPVKRMSTESVISQEVKIKGFGGMGAGVRTKKYGLEGLTCEDLPSAFDDSDDEKG
jgi:hypothetical protein